MFPWIITMVFSVLWLLSGAQLVGGSDACKILPNTTDLMVSIGEKAECLWNIGSNVCMIRGCIERVPENDITNGVCPKGYSALFTMAVNDSELSYMGQFQDDSDLFTRIQLTEHFSHGKFGIAIKNVTGKDFYIKIQLLLKKIGEFRAKCYLEVPGYQLVKAVGTPEPESPSRTTTPTATPTATPTTTPGNASSTTPGPSRNPNASELSKVEIAALVIGLALALFLAILVFQYPRLRSANNRCTCV